MTHLLPTRGEWLVSRTSAAREPNRSTRLAAIAERATGVDIVVGT
jgi:hypothetical protein